MSEEVLSAPHAIEYTYTRSTGPVLGAFLTANAMALDFHEDVIQAESGDHFAEARCL